MAKRILLLLLSLTLVLSFATPPVFAGSSFADASPDTIVGYLVSDTGEKELVVGKRVDTPVLFSVDPNMHSSTYEFTLYSDPTYALTATQTDGSISVRAHLTIHYATQNTPTEALLTKVSGYWEILDPKARVDSTTLNYGCSGSFPESVIQTNTASVGNYFNVNTGFTKYVTPQFGVIGATWTLELGMGTSRHWTLCIQNNL